MTATEYLDTYPERARRLCEQIKSAASGVRLAKSTSNLFRDRSDNKADRLSVGDFNHLLEMDVDHHTLTCEGMMTYENLVDETLKFGFMPTVVPQLKSITLGGAVSGIGIESTSFRHGLPHEKILEMDVLLADGSIVTCSADNEHADLFYGLPNSYGTLGYALKLKAKALPVKPFVRLNHEGFDSLSKFFEKIQVLKDSNIDFLDGSVYGHGQYYLTTGKFVDTAPFTSDYTYLQIYYKSIREKQTDYLSVKDYIWRWDTDWFWCSKNLYVQNPVMRRLVGKKRLNSVSYTQVMRLNSKWGIKRRLDRLSGYYPESVIQDIDIPIDNAAEFLEFLMREIGVLPIWICPIATNKNSEKFPLFSLSPDHMYINFGFWDSVKAKAKRPEGYLNRKIEKMTEKLNGKKSLYSDSYYDEHEFWSQYNEQCYWDLKRRYDPNNRFLNLYEKCVLRK